VLRLDKKFGDERDRRLSDRAACTEGNGSLNSILLDGYARCVFEELIDLKRACAALEMQCIFDSEYNLETHQN
jgi:hypothetical protein